MKRDRARQWQIFAVAVGAIATGSLLLHCQAIPLPPPQTNPDIAKVKAVLQRNIRALNREDLPAYLNTLDRRTDKFARSKQLAQELQRTYDLHYQIRNIDVIEMADSQMKLRVVQETRKLKGPAFKNNRMVAVHTFQRLVDGWKIANTEIERIEYLESQP